MLKKHRNYYTEINIVTYYSVIWFLSIMLWNY